MYFRIYIILIFAGINFSSQAQTFNFRNEKQKKFTLSFKLVSNLVIIPLKINNSDTLNFILDTGIKSTMLIDASSSKFLNLKDMRSQKIRGLGQGNDIDVLVSTGNRFNIGEIFGENQTVYIVMGNQFNIKQKVGEKIHGIIGGEIFNNFIVEIRYSSQRVIFHSKKFFQTPSERKNRTTIPIIILDSKPYLKTSLVLDNDSVVELFLLLDTGASDALWLFTASDSQIKIPSKTIYTYLGSGLNGEIFGNKGRIKKISFGKFEILNSTASFPDTAAVQLSFNLSKQNGNIGGEILKRFNLTFNYFEKTLTLRKNFFFSMSRLM